METDHSQDTGWFQLAPGHLAYLLARVVPDQFYLDGELAGGVDAAELLRSGVGSGTILNGGRFVVWVTLPSMIAARRFDDLARWFADDASGLGRSPHYLRHFCLDHDRGRALDGVLRETADVDECIARSALLLTAWNYRGLAHRELSKAGGLAEEAEALADCARAWQTLFQEEDEARRCLGAAEKLAHVAHAWACICSAWLRLKDREMAFRAAERAEAVASHCYAWLWAGGNWDEAFDDKERTHRCFERAAAVARRTDWTEMAYRYRHHDDDSERARGCMIKAEIRSRNCVEHLYCADAWIRLLGDHGEAANSIRSAERRSKDSLNWAECAVSWKDLLHEEEQARRCLAAAERAARACDDWAICAYNWTIFPEARSNSYRCMHVAERLARSVNDFSECKSAWEVIGDQDKIAYFEKKIREARMRGET
jgi:hypothetical protein